MVDKLPNLVILFGGNKLAENKDKALLNPYGVLVVNPDKHPGVNYDLALKFVKWIVSVDEQKKIGGYGADKFGQPLFYPSSAEYKSLPPAAALTISSCPPLVLSWRNGGTVDEFISGLIQAINLIVSGDQALLEIVSLTLQVSGIALLLSTLVGLPIGAALGLYRVPGRRLITALLYTGMGLPPVVVGLFVYLMLSRSGPLGLLGWLFTPNAMVTAQTIIAFPLVTGLTMTAVQGVDPALNMQVRALGATRLQEAWTVLTEARIGVVAAIVAAFGGIISEVGAVMLVGGNIAGKTRVLTTAIVLNTRQGEFELALALGVILLALAFAANIALLRLR
jgi:tungstate transport system permease protein